MITHELAYKAKITTSGFCPPKFGCNFLLQFQEQVAPPLSDRLPFGLISLFRGELC